MSDCSTCLHYRPCKLDMTIKWTGDKWKCFGDPLTSREEGEFNCIIYEPKRVKCEGECVKTRDEYINILDDALFETRTIKNKFCPKCGTRIEVK